MRKYQLIICLSFYVIFGPSLFAQEHENTSHNQEESQEEQHRPRHGISASVSHTIIFNAVKNGESPSALHVPSFGLNYTFSINPKWSIGLHNDIILEEFVIEKTITGNINEEVEYIERETPIAVAVVAIYKPLPYLGLMAGAGREFTHQEDFNLLRFGIESPVHLGHHWEVFGMVAYDINIDAYDSLTYGIGIGKIF